MKISLKSSLLLFLSLIVFLSCEDMWDKDHLFSYEEPRDGLMVYDCSNYKEWHFFSFDEDIIIGTCDALDEEAYASWYNRTDWDLAFHRQNIKANSGLSGVGLGGIQEYKQDVFDYEAITQAPMTGYVTDVADSVVYDLSQMMAGIIIYAHTGVSQPVKDWAVLTDMMNGVWTYAQKAFIVRTASGKYAKIYLKNFKSKEGVSGTVTMEYTYQPDGTPNLLVEEEEEPENPGGENPENK